MQFQPEAGKWQLCSTLSVNALYLVSSLCFATFLCTGFYKNLAQLQEEVKTARPISNVSLSARAMRKKLQSSSDSGDSGSKKWKRSYGGAYGAVWQSLRFARVWSLKSGSRFCVSAFGRNLASVAVKIFTHFIYFIKKFYTFCIFNVI
jgi:hypothetical protein